MANFYRKQFEKSFNTNILNLIEVASFKIKITVSKNLAYFKSAKANSSDKIWYILKKLNGVIFFD